MPTRTKSSKATQVAEFTIKKQIEYADVPRKTHGVRSGLGVMEFWAFLFELNEGLPKSQKMVDAEITRQMKLEFPKRASVTRRIDEGKTQVGYYRSRYNAGTLIPKSGKPKLRSYRYNNDGLRMDGRSGMALSNSQQRVQGKPKRKAK